MNSEEHQPRSANDARDAAGRLGARNPKPPQTPVTPQQPPKPPQGPQPGGPHDDRLTTVLPPVRGEHSAPLDVVKAALEGTTARASSQSASSQSPSPVSNSPMSQSGPPGPPKPPSAGGPSGPTEPPASPPRKFEVNWRWIRRGLVAAVVVAMLLPLVTFGMAYMIVDVPQPGDIRTAQVSTIMASDGSEIAKVVPPEGNRIDVKIDQIPVHVRDAVMAAEDRDFYSNPGFSFTGFLRAIKNNMFGGDLQGGSTITQQYVKNALVGDERTGVGGLVRKAKELVISTKMANQWSKDDVMQAYLNMIYFGRGAYGIAAASKAYFDKPVEQLDVAEGALLAALIQRPSTLDPAVDPKGAADRWNWVLDGMVDIGALSPADRAAQEFPRTVSRDQAQQQDQATGSDGLIERQVMKELTGLFNVSEQALNTEGLQITTTIDPQAQRAAENAVSRYMEGQNPDMRTAVVSIDPTDGGIEAYYGGSDANGFDFAQAGLPTGSAFKVFALVAALEQGIGLGYQIDSSPLTVNGISISNVQGDSCGVCSVAEALKRSLNTSFYRLMLQLQNGPEDVAKAAHEAGIAESFPGVEHTLSEDGKGGPPNNGIVLGQYQSRVLDMASAYATLAASGMYHKPHFVQKVVNAAGQVLYDAANNDDGEQRIDKAVADNVTSAMQPIAGWSAGHNLAGGRPSAAKTGTNQLGDTGDNRDAWMVGYTPSLSTAVWVGTAEGVEPLKTRWGGPVYGSGLPSDIWKATMDGALQGTDIQSFPKPTAIGGYAGVPQAPPVRTGPSQPGESGSVTPPSQTVIQPTIEVAPGITIPIGPPTTVPVGPAPLPGPAPQQGVGPGQGQGPGLGPQPGLGPESPPNESGAPPGAPVVPPPPP